MSDSNRTPGRRRPGKNVYTTKTGNTIKLNRSLSERVRAKREAKARKRAAYLSTLPRNRFKRILFHLQPKRVAKYWFSREGGIMALKVIGIGIVVGFLVLVGVFAYFRKDLPNIKNISGDNLGGSITYYDRTGKTVLWQDYNAVQRVPVPGDQISNYMREATVAIEDKNFYKHGAFDVQGILRAAVTDATHHGGTVEGGSTITQQLVKLNENWTDDRTIARKIKELILAVELEREYSKADILNGYLNIAPYGNIQYGVQAAAQDYFGKDAKDLTLAESAFLAAIPQSPSYYSPYGAGYDPTAVTERQDYILDQMVKQGMIPQSQATQAKAVNVLGEIKPEQNLYSNIKAPYFVLAAKNQLEQKYGTEIVNRGGWKVTTTLDLNLQNIAETAVQKNLPNVKHYGGDEEAMAAEQTQTGQMVSEVGGVDFQDPDHGQINYAQINLSPGSSFKPYDYASFINDTTNAGAGSVLYDVQQPLLTKQDGGYPCTDKTKPSVTNPSDPSGANKCLWDYDFVFPGALPLRYALAGSRNVPAVKTMLTVGTQKVINTADAMIGNSDAYNCYQQGVNVETASKSQESRCYASSAIGDGAYIHLDQHVNGLATLGRLGKSIPQTYILKIVDASGKIIYNWTQPKGTQVIRPDAAWIVDSMLSDPNASYLRSDKKFQHYKGWDFAVKTGTTNDNFDGLMTSWSTQYAVASWVGYHTRNKALTAGGMEDMTTPLTRTWMEGATDALGLKQPVNWTMPSDVKTCSAYVVHSGWGSGAILPSPSQDYYPSWYTGKACGGGSDTGSQTIDKVSGLLASSCTPPAAKETLGGSNGNIFSADIFYNASGSSASNGTITGTDNVHQCSDSPPSVTLTQTNCDDTGKCDFVAAITQGTQPLSGGSYTASPAGTISLLVNGQVVQTADIPAGTSPYTITFSGISTTTGQSVEADAYDSVLYEGTYKLTAAQPAGTTTGTPAT